MTGTRDLLFICGDLCNLGDLALLLQNLEIARDQGRRAWVRRWAPLPAEIEEQVSEAAGRIVDGRDLPRFLSLASRCDMVIGGGQLVRENVSTRSLLFLAMGVTACKLRGGRVATRGLGVSAVRSRKLRLLWRQVLGRAGDIRVRDEASAVNAARIVPGAKVLQTADMAFYPSRLHGHESRAAAASPSILIAPCIDGSEERSIDGAALPRLLEAARTRFPDAELVFACHDPRPGMDAKASDLLIEGHGLRARKSAGNRLDVLLEEYGRAGIVITNRLHSVIFSLLSKRPVLVVDDGSRKIAAVATAFRIPTIGRGDESGAEEAVATALDFDRDVRAAALDDMSARAKRNLSSD
ncbi:polysaccharide pyruvyl transferase family protein [Antarcticirhabdus aurantiaca]|uniref:Polysaccharide pyruvyl transferase family protein n=1 Tax=Antarcticirhabdus aurantiaca TaxID=2606717 RepID=A0ACD4NQS0_9HYPH|nr:polysaccharide pyruvyl transferase family protein [Antarcticirhabdus aurantiaca]WAJ29182.1 polysaccharide pyruvyl transferase family protein [Jeongeuplla avenae]